MFENGIGILYWMPTENLIKFYRKRNCAHTETIPTSDYRDGKKSKIVSKSWRNSSRIMILIMIIESYLKKIEKW
jgi:hypothetical protein